MAKKEFNLTEIKQGYNLCWYVCCQTAARPKVTLKDDKGKVYFTCAKDNGGNNLQVISQGHGDFTGTNLTLTIEIGGNGEIKHSISASNITDSAAKKVGQSYSFCIEDYIDEDYNDVYVNVVGWARKG